jgi:polyphosphate glucokinase
MRKPAMKVLVIDIGGTHVKVLATGQEAEREFVSGPTLTPKRMVSGVRKLVADWKYDIISSLPRRIPPVGRGQEFHAR